MKTKNMGITIFIFTCIFRHKVLEYPTNYQGAQHPPTFASSVLRANS